MGLGVGFFNIILHQNIHPNPIVKVLSLASCFPEVVGFKV